MTDPPSRDRLIGAPPLAGLFLICAPVSTGSGRSRGLRRLPWLGMHADRQRRRQRRLAKAADFRRVRERRGGRQSPARTVLCVRPGTLMSLVGAAGFEPATPCSRSRCATRLRYAPPRGAVYRGRSRAPQAIAGTHRFLRDFAAGTRRFSRRVCVAGWRRTRYSEPASGPWGVAKR